MTTAQQEHLTAIEAALTKGMALHAVVLGAQNSLADIEVDANAKKDDADVKRRASDDEAEQVRAKAFSAARKIAEALHGRQQKRIDDGHSVVAEALTELNEHRATVKKEFGIDIPDYLEQARGGRVKL